MKKIRYQDLAHLIPSRSISPEERRVFLTQPTNFLNLVNSARGKRLDIADFEILQPWGVAAIAALSRGAQPDRVIASNSHASLVGNFAQAIGFDEAIDNVEPAKATEQGRTLKLRRIVRYEEIDSVSSEIANMAVMDSKDTATNPDEYIDSDEVSKTIAYVIIELLRNVIQHSNDNLGGVILAQRMNKGRGIGYESESFIQVTVADCGIGIYESLLATRPEITSAKMALERSIWPRVSGKFYEWQKGGAQNAGLGLFFVSEMAKSTGGRLLVASRGGSLLIQGDPEALGNNKIDILDAEYPGTLVVFEMPKRGVSDYDALIRKIQDIAYSRMVKSENAAYIRFANIPNDAFEFSVKIAAENTAVAEDFARKTLVQKISEGTPIVFNFANVKICTQSFLHALLFQVLQEAKGRGVALFAKNYNDAIRDQIRLVEMYTLSD